MPIPGTTKHHRLDENLAAQSLALTADDPQNIDRASPSPAIATGKRFRK